MSIHVVTVFGGTGFLGRRIVRHLRKHEFSVRIASRHPDRSRKLFGSDDPCLQSVEVDTRDERVVADVLAGTYAAVNAVGLYVERGQDTFHSVHVEAAERVAVQAHRAGVERLAHVSGLGADAASPSLYIRKRGEGELAVKAAFTDAILIRPAVMFGPDDAFLTTMLALLRRLPIYPMFGHGRTRLQPPMWKTWRRRSHGPCSGRKRMASRSSAAALVSTRMRNCSAPLHAKPTSSAS
jgi:NADH dehydrogenase